MNREQAATLLPIIKAFSEGEYVEYMSPISEEWFPAGEPTREAR